MNNATRYLFAYVIDKAQSEPLQTRIKLYHAMAALSHSKEESNDLIKIANALEDAERSSIQLALNFRLRT